MSAHKEVFQYRALDSTGVERSGTLLAGDQMEVIEQLPAGWTLVRCQPWNAGGAAANEPANEPVSEPGVPRPAAEGTTAGRAGVPGSVGSEPASWGGAGLGPQNRGLQPIGTEGSPVGDLGGGTSGSGLVGGGSGGGSAPLGGSARLGGGARLGGAAGEELAGHLAALTQAGVPLEGGLRALLEEMPGGRLKRGIERLLRDLEAGVDLETAIRQCGATEPLQAVVRGGLQQGDLGAALARHAATSQALGDSRLMLWSALAGPVVGGVLCGLLLLVLVGWLVPQFAELFSGFGLQLPLVTIWLFAVSSWLNSWGWLVLVGGAAVAMAGVLAGWVRWVPLVGSLVHSLGLMRLCDMLALMVDSRVPLPEALRLAGKASGQRGLQQEAERLAAELSRGEDVNHKPGRWRRLPAGLVELVASAGQQSTLVALLQAQTSLQVQRARGVAQLIVLLLPWLLLPTLGAVIVLTIVALYLPMMQLLRSLI